MSFVKPFNSVNRWMVLCTSIALATFTNSYAQTSTVGLQAMRTFVAQQKSISGDFVQINEGKKSRQSGRFAMAKPDKFRWEIKKPFEQLLISDGQTLTQWDVDLNQATQRSSEGLLNNTPAALLMGGVAVEKQFGLQDAGNSEGLNWVKATPNKNEGSFKSIKLGFKNGVPAVLLAQDSFGGNVRIELKNIKTTPINPSTFQLSLPKDADIVKI
jgi:outer membrane lipoprotein carrier protein